MVLAKLEYLYSEWPKLVCAKPENPTNTQKMMRPSQNNSFATSLRAKTTTRKKVECLLTRF